MMKNPVCLLGLLAWAASLAPAPAAQTLPPGSGFDWQRVGGFPINADDLAFGPDSLGRPAARLWALSAEGLLRLDTTGGALPTWFVVDRFRTAYRLLPLSADTLLVLYVGVLRSTDGGRTFEIVIDVTDSPYFSLTEIPEGVAHAGRLLAGDSGNLQITDDNRYSDDRGATWSVSAVPEWGGGRDRVVVPAGGPYAGYVVSATWRGAMYSADGGATYHESNLWGFALGELVCVVEGPGGLPRVLLADNAGSGRVNIWSSDDGGQTWTLAAPTLGGSGLAGLLGLGGPSAVMVEADGTVRRSDDAGETWAAVGRAPDVTTSLTVRAATAELGPDGRLYVGLSRNGCCERGWVYRTEPLEPVAAEPAPGPVDEGLGLEVRPNPSGGAAVVAFTLAQPSEVVVALYDTLGRRVALLQEGARSAGRHTFALDTARFAPGVYVVRVETEDAVVTHLLTRLE
jgi:hypothetical protein